ncbi:MAG: hypothetical protein GY950_30040 [bacterium]|nr:hypothetical protein [bacterium]
MNVKAKKGKLKQLKLTFVVVTALFLLLSLFLTVSEKYRESVFGIGGGVKQQIQLKLSPDDLILLNNRGTKQWINVNLIESNKKKIRIKIKPLGGSGMDFQLKIVETVYNLYKLDKERTPVYKLFKQARDWQLQCTSPLQSQLKINGVFIGNYLMEEFIYEQLRDDRDNYFIRLQTDSHRMRKIQYEVENGHTETLKKHFHMTELATYFMFFSLFRPAEDSPPDFGRLVFRFEPRNKKYRSYLTMESIISCLEQPGKTVTFRKPAKREITLLKQLDKTKAERLADECRGTRFAALIAAVLTPGNVNTTPGEEKKTGK